METFVPTLHLKSYDKISPLRPELSVKGKSVLITGGGYGLGSAFARSFAAAGASKLTLVGRTQLYLWPTVDDLRREFPNTTVSYYVADITDEEAMKNIFDALGAPDILVNNAGTFFGGETLKDVDIKKWWNTTEVNVLGTAIVTQQYLRTKPAEKEGTVIMLNSTASHWGTLPGMSHYCTSKAALLRFSEMLQVEHPELRIVNINPGFVETEMAEKARKAGLVGLPVSDSALVGDFGVWACSEEAEFLKGRYVLSMFDVEELMERKEEIMAKNLLTYTIAGF